MNLNHNKPLVERQKKLLLKFSMRSVGVLLPLIGWDGYQQPSFQPTGHLSSICEASRIGSKLADGLVSEVADFRSKPMGFTTGFEFFWQNLLGIKNGICFRNHKYLGVVEFEHGVYTPNYCHLVDETQI